MSAFSIESILALYSIPTIGPTRMRKLISCLDSPEAVLSASYRTLTQIEGIDAKTAQRIKNGPDQQFIDEQLKEIKKHDVSILTYWDKAYPERLKKIYDPPAFLLVKGDLGCLSEPAFAVVGTRHPSSYGKIVTEEFSIELIRNGFVIISGFARGIDSVAHRTALKRNGKTIAVLGNGIDQIYPAENRELYQQIMQKGLIISEYPMGTKPDAGNFPKRNRIISGISCGILVTEAGDKSGALITALYANDQNREVFAVPGTIKSARSTGTNRLIKTGAKLVQNFNDILEELDGQLNLKIRAGETEKPLPPLNTREQKVLTLLEKEPIHIDQLAIRAELAPAEILSSLLQLELLGLIRQLAGKMFVKL